MGTSARAAVLAYEGPNYASAGSLSGLSGGSSGWGALGWTPVSTADFAVASPGLTFSNGGTIGSASTNTAQAPASAGQNGDIRNLATPITSGTFYISALFNETGENIGGDSALLIRLDTTTARDPQLAAFGIDDGSGGNVVISNDGGIFPGSDFSDASGFALGTTHLVVAQVNLNTDTISIYGDPTVGGAQPATPTVTASMVGASAGSPVAGIDIATNFAQGNIDEITLGTTWADVTGGTVPEPTSLSLLSLGAAGLLRRRRKTR